MEGRTRGSKRVRNALFILIFVIAVITGGLYYYNNSGYVGGEIWKYRNGAHFGDVISVREGFEFRDNTIYQGEQLVAHIYLCIPNLLILKAPETGVIGYYIKKS